jgi:hypothetical protein
LERTWTQCYYDSLEFFYWEPQHLGKKKHDKATSKTVGEVRENLRKKEVTLNHNLSQFFVLAPPSVRCQLFHFAFSRPFKNEYTLHGRGIEEGYDLACSTQPDLFFTSPAEVISVEMKIEAKSTVDQVLKYALLGLADEIASGRQKSHYLTYLAPGQFPTLWKQGFQDVGQLKRALRDANLSEFLRKHPRRFHDQATQFRRIIDEMTLGSTTYSELARLLQNLMPQESDSSDGAFVYRKLIEGLVGELQLRKLA